jgi:hypothetical protein
MSDQLSTQQELWLFRNGYHIRIEIVSDDASGDLYYYPLYSVYNGDDCLDDGDYYSPRAAVAAVMEQGDT